MKRKLIGIFTVIAFGCAVFIAASMSAKHNSTEDLQQTVCISECEMTEGIASEMAAFYTEEVLNAAADSENEGTDTVSETEATEMLDASNANMADPANNSLSENKSGSAGSSSGNSDSTTKKTKQTAGSGSNSKDTTSGSSASSTPSAASTVSKSSGTSSQTSPASGSGSSSGNHDTDKTPGPSSSGSSSESTESAAPAHVHSYSSRLTKEPTCTADGVRTYTCSCGNTYSEAVPAKGHSWSTKTSELWIVDKEEYTEKVKTTYGGYKCSTCGLKFTKEECESGQLTQHQKDTGHSGTSSWTDTKITTVKHEEEGHYEEVVTTYCTVCGSVK